MMPMNRKASIVAILIAVFFIYSVAMLPSVLADTWLPSGTIQLVPESYLQYFVQLQKGDRFEGNFTVTDLTPHNPTTNLPWVNQSQIQTFGVEISAFAEIGKGSESPQIFHFGNDYLNPTGESQYFFNYTAEYSAFYYVVIYCSTNIFDNVAIPKVIINYNVIEAAPFKLQILSPLNQTYRESSIPLSIATVREVITMSYSLDGNINATFNGNTTLTGLADGMHHISVYAIDSNNYTYTQIITFTVLHTSQTPTSTQTSTRQPTLEPTSTPNNTQSENFTPLLITVGLVIVAVVVLSSIVYIKKRRKTE